MKYDLCLKRLEEFWLPVYHLFVHSWIQVDPSCITQNLKLVCCLNTLRVFTFLQAASGGTNRWDAVAVGDSERTHKFQKLMVRIIPPRCLSSSL